LAIDIVQEIENLLGRQAVEALDFEALEVAVRQQVLQLAGQAVAQRLNADLSDQVGCCVPLVEGRRAMLGAAPSKSRVSLAPYLWSVPTITVLPAGTASALGISISE
jgi:hypothetical protein